MQWMIDRAWKKYVVPAPDIVHNILSPGDALLCVCFCFGVVWGAAEKGGLSLAHLWTVQCTVYSA